MGEKSGSASGRVSYGLSLSATELLASKLETRSFLLIRILVFPVKPAQEEVFPDLNWTSMLTVEDLIELCSGAQLG